MLIHLIRHTTPAIEPGICYGQSDLDLTQSFDQERDTVLSKLHNEYDALFTSPLRRCAKLAQSISAKQRASDERLMEYNFGDWELLPWDQFKSDASIHWMNNFVDQPAPNGDSILSMQARVNDFFDELFQQDYKSVAVVTHSGVQRLLHARVLQTPLENMFSLQLDFGAVMELKYNGVTDNGAGNNNDAFLTIKHL